MSTRPYRFFGVVTNDEGAVTSKGHHVLWHRLREDATTECRLPSLPSKDGFTYATGLLRDPNGDGHAKCGACVAAVEARGDAFYP